MERALKGYTIRAAAAVLCFCLLLGLIVSGVLLLTRRSVIGEELGMLQGSLQTMLDSIDMIYSSNIDYQLEKVFSASHVVSFSFSSRNWPASHACIERIRDDLVAMCESSPYISTAFLYNPVTDQYASSLARFDAVADTEFDPYIREVIYAYNSGSVERQRFGESEHPTFQFIYNGKMYLAKELAARTGQSLCTLFASLNTDSLISALSAASRQDSNFVVNVYDPYYNLLFTSSAEPVDLSFKDLALLAEDADGIDTAGSQYRLYFASNTLPWRYVAILEREYVDSLRNVSRSGTAFAVTAVLLLILLAVALIYMRIKTPLLETLRNIGAERTETGPSKGLFHVLRTCTEKMADENRRLRGIVSHTGDEVIKSMFLGLVMGQQYDPRDIAFTLSCSDTGFQTNDVYVAGIAKCPADEVVSSEKRLEILNVIHNVLDQFERKHDCNTFAFASDTSKFALIVSYPPDKTIAEGKVMTTELSRLLLEKFPSTGIPMALYFGHLYHSILDIGFSYSEADRATDERLGTVSPVILAAAPIQDAGPDAGMQTEADDAGIERLNRRAAQITRLVHKGRDEEAFALTRRVTDGIFSSDSYDRQCSETKYFISALIESIVSYDFISHNQLSNVTTGIYEAIENRFPSNALEDRLYGASITLCREFSAILKRQRNPIVKAAFDYIEQNYSNPDLSLNEIADALGVAPNYLSNLFSKNIGVKLFDYINDFRIKKALVLLTTTEETVNSISLKSGFSTPRNFIRVFKKNMDTTPGAYRKQSAGIS